MNRMRKNNTKRHIALSAVCLVLALFLSLGTAYAWFVFRWTFTPTDFGGGTLSAVFDGFKAWRKGEDGAAGSWSDSVYTDADSATLSPDLGSMMLANQLPEDCNAYFAFKLNDVNFSDYEYSLILETVNVEIGKNTAGGYELKSSINYFDYNFIRLSYAVVAAETDGSLPEPTAEQYSESSLMLSENQTVVSGVAKEQWAYIRLELDDNAFFELITDIPSEWMPYFVSMQIVIGGETKTLPATV